MKDISIRITSIIAAVAVLLSYNIVLAMRGKNEEIAKLSAEIEASSIASAGDEAGYKDGIYTGASQGYSDLITVELEISAGKIKDIKIISAPGEDPAYLSMAEALIPKMIEQQTTAVDTVSGATMSSIGLINAASMALNEGL